MDIDEYLTHPTESISRVIEDLIIQKEKTSNRFAKIGFDITARAISATVFPLFLLMELTLKRAPKALLAVKSDRFYLKVDKVKKFAFSIIPAIPLGILFPEAVPAFFLKRRATAREICPFGVEHVFGTRFNRPIDYPKNAEEVSQIVKEAKAQNGTVSVIGAGMSQGTQTVPPQEGGRVIHTKELKQIQVNENTVTVGAGATWEEIQLELDRHNKSAIVKQASDIFSIGGSISINCHGWAHEYGAISSTVRSLKIIDANGDLQELFPPRKGIPLEQLTDKEKLFMCQFGTLGYFGVIVEATLDIVNNVNVIQETKEVSPSEFIEIYKNEVKGQNIPLFGGRLTLDMLDGNPLRSVCMVNYKLANESDSPRARTISQEPKLGERIERIALNLFSHLPNAFSKRLLSYFWSQERQKMMERITLSRNEALHPPINAFKFLHHSNLHTQWLQEYFIREENLADFLSYLGSKLQENDVRLVNATIRPTPKDEISILPYAERDRYGVVICFAQKKTEEEMLKTENWVREVNGYLQEKGDIFYQAYMPYATKEEFEACYGKEKVETMRALKTHFDPNHLFGNAHTAKYFD